MKHIVYDVCVYEYLSYKYPHIFEAMLCEDFFILQDKVYDILIEITYFGSVVGFLTGEFIDGYLVCDLCFILEDYRGMGLFKNTLVYVNDLFDIGVLLYLPNVFAVESLIKNSLAIKISDRLVISRFPMIYINKGSGKRLISRIYDLKECAIVHLGDKSLSPLLDVDVLVRNPPRECIDDAYFTMVESMLLRSLCL